MARSEMSYREIPKDTPTEDLIINYDYYDHRDADKDPNVILPLDRFRELEEEGYIGELAEMGRMYKRTALQTQLAAEIARKVKSAKVDVLFCIPA